MKRVLLTGMSGTGKSTVIGELAARGYKAVDADTDEFSEWKELTQEELTQEELTQEELTQEELTQEVSDDTGLSGTARGGSTVEPGRDWVWRTDRIRALLSAEDADILFLSGCAENMGQFLPQFDHIVLLSAPPEVIVQRLSTRTNNVYGKQPGEVARVLDLIEAVEPLLRSIAGYEIVTSTSLADVVASLLRHVGQQLQERASGEAGRVSDAPLLPH